MAGDVFALARGDARATIARRGAEPVALTLGGRELLWTPDPAVWLATSPVLFPIVGRAAGGIVRVGGKVYPMGIHGFAAGLDFAPVAQGPDFVTLALSDTPRTLAAYPFRFRLEAAYRLDGTGLSAGFTVTNRNDAAMPYALGLHPGFRWPFAGTARDGHRVEFERVERPSVPAITRAGLFSTVPRPVPLEGRVLALSDALMAREALCFLDAASRSVAFEAPSGEAVTMEVEDFPHFALWTLPPAPYLCVEAWTGHGDPDGYAGELADKPSMRLLAPGASATHRLRIGFRAGRGRPDGFGESGT